MKKKMIEGPGPKKRKFVEEEPGSLFKRRNMEEEEKCLTREERNEIMKTQEVLIGDYLILGYLRNLKWWN